MVTRTMREHPHTCESAVLNHFAIKAFCHIFGRRADVTHPRSGSFGPHGHRIDFCESAVFDHFPIKAFCTLWNNDPVNCSAKCKMLL
jgi:hypothetical protein